MESQPINQYVSRTLQQCTGFSVRGPLRYYPVPQIPLPPATPGARLLDLGCNWGRWSLAAAARGYHAVGVDRDQEALRAAVEVAQQLGRSEQSDFLRADLRTRLPFADASFDTVFSFGTLYYLSKANLTGLAGEIRRLLRPGGLAKLHFSNSDGLRRRWSIRRGRTSPHVTHLRLDEMRALFKGDHCRLEAASYFTSGGVPDVIPLLTWPIRSVVRVSSLLLALSRHVRFLCDAADMVYLVVVTRA